MALPTMQRFYKIMSNHTKEDMDYTEGIFGIIIEKRKKTAPLLHLYTDDDGNYTHCLSIDIGWRPDLIKILNKIKLTKYGNPRQKREKMSNDQEKELILVDGEYAYIRI